MLRFPAPRRAAVVGVLGLALFAGACSNQGSATESQSQAAPAATTPMASSEPFGAACSTVPTSGPGSLAGMAKDPVATAASNNPALSTLVTAVQKAGLVDTLNSAEGITVFAPTNDAFSAVPKATLDKALGDPKGLLTTVLTYHVVPGQLSPDKLAGTARTRPCRAGRSRCPVAARTSRSTAGPAWCAATFRPPTPPSTSSTASYCPRAEPLQRADPRSARRGH